MLVVLEKIPSANVLSKLCFFRLIAFTYYRANKDYIIYIYISVLQKVHPVSGDCLIDWDRDRLSNN